VLAAAGASHVVAVEPSKAFDVLTKTTAAVRDRVTCLNISGDTLPPSGDLDYVFAIGVIHHIVDPDPVIRAARGALRPGGTLAVWLYGREGNAMYLLFVKSLWWFTRRLPHRALALFVAALYPVLWSYMQIARAAPLPLAEYMRRVMLPLTPDKRRVVMYDQLNPAYAKYYSRAEAQSLLERNQFTDIRMHHRHGCSWTVTGTRP
jgi:SAM-dependent methyltransferase